MKTVDYLGAVGTVNPQLAKKHRAGVGYAPPARDLKREQRVRWSYGYQAFSVLGPTSTGKKRQDFALQAFPASKPQIANMHIEVVAVDIFKPSP